jgi:hypothetical protein
MKTTQHTGWFFDGTEAHYYGKMLGHLSTIQSVLRAEGMLDAAASLALVHRFFERNSETVYLPIEAVVEVEVVPARGEKVLEAVNG